MFLWFCYDKQFIFYWLDKRYIFCIWKIDFVFMFDLFLWILWFLVNFWLRSTLRNEHRFLHHHYNARFCLVCWIHERNFAGQKFTPLKPTTQAVFIQILLTKINRTLSRSCRWSCWRACRSPSSGGPRRGPWRGFRFIRLFKYSI